MSISHKRMSRPIALPRPIPLAATSLPSQPRWNSRSLAVIAEGPHPFVPDSKEHVLRRAAPAISNATDFPDEQYQVPNLKTVDLSWAGRLGPGHASLAAISAAKVGDPLQIARDGLTWIIQDARGQVLGRMAKLVAT